MRWDFPSIHKTIEEESAQISDEKTLEAFRLKYLGKKGLIPEMYASFPTLAPEEKAAVGKGANDLKTLVTQIIEEKKRGLQTQSSSNKKGALDVTIPGVAHPVGRKHILT